MATEYPVNYVKGDSEELAVDNASAVSLRFRGYRPAKDVVPASDTDEPAYAELQAQAKSLQEKGHDLKATGSYDELFAAVTEAQDVQNELDA